MKKDKYKSVTALNRRSSMGSDDRKDGPQINVDGSSRQPSVRDSAGSLDSQGNPKKIYRRKMTFADYMKKKKAHSVAVSHYDKDSQETGPYGELQSKAGIESIHLKPRNDEKNSIDSYQMSAFMQSKGRASKTEATRTSKDRSSVPESAATGDAPLS